MNLRTYTNPGELHERRDAEIRILLRGLGMTESALNVWVGQRYETSSRWDQLSIATKTEIVLHLDSLIIERKERLKNDSA